MREALITSPGKWRLIELLAQQPRTVGELAQLTRTSPSNVSQQLRLLLAYDFIKAESTPRTGPGKPGGRYTLKSPFAYLCFARPHHSARRFLRLNPTALLVMNILSWPQANDHDLLFNLMWQHHDLFEKAQGVYLVKSTPEGIDLLVVTEHVEEIRKHKSTLRVAEQSGKSRPVAVWTHSRQELIDGLRRGDEYFHNLTRKVHALHEEGPIIDEVREASDG